MHFMVYADVPQSRKKRQSIVKNINNTTADDLCPVPGSPGILGIPASGSGAKKPCLEKKAVLTVRSVVVIHFG